MCITLVQHQGNKLFPHCQGSSSTKPLSTFDPCSGAESQFRNALKTNICLASFNDQTATIRIKPDLFSVGCNHLFIK